jgi:hypothetical protein
MLTLTRATSLPLLLAGASAAGLQALCFAAKPTPEVHLQAALQVRLHSGWVAAAGDQLLTQERCHGPRLRARCGRNNAGLRRQAHAGMSATVDRVMRASMLTATPATHLKRALQGWHLLERVKVDSKGVGGRRRDVQADQLLHDVPHAQACMSRGTQASCVCVCVCVRV